MPKNTWDENPQEIDAEEKKKGFRARLITDGVFIFSLVVGFLVYSFQEETEGNRLYWWIGTVYIIGLHHVLRLKDSHKEKIAALRRRVERLEKHSHD